MPCPRPNQSSSAAGRWTAPTWPSWRGAAARIPPAGEAAYVIDGLLYHEADLSIAVHHTDGGGVSDHVFALATLLGFRFAPRIPNLAERRLYAFGPASRWTALAPFIAGRPEDKLIEAQRYPLLRA